MTDMCIGNQKFLESLDMELLQLAAEQDVAEDELNETYRKYIEAKKAAAICDTDKNNLTMSKAEDEYDDAYNWLSMVEEAMRHISELRKLYM